jgi:hypothetical protein
MTDLEKEFGKMKVGEINNKKLSEYGEAFSNYFDFENTFYKN